jgi:hypothetical protein
MIRAWLRFYFRPTLANWRALRRICMKKLPKPSVLRAAKKEPSNANG